jgi:hypothetical protein
MRPAGRVGHHRIGDAMKSHSPCALVGRREQDPVDVDVSRIEPPHRHGDALDGPQSTSQIRHMTAADPITASSSMRKLSANGSGDANAVLTCP